MVTYVWPIRLAWFKPYNAKFPLGRIGEHRFDTSDISNLSLRLLLLLGFVVERRRGLLFSLTLLLLLLRLATVKHADEAFEVVALLNLFGDRGRTLTNVVECLRRTIFDVVAQITLGRGVLELCRLGTGPV